MQYRYLGRTGMKVSELCLGAMTFGRESTEADSIQMMNRFVAPNVAGFLYSIEIVTMAVLGGAGSVLGAIFGTALLTLLPQVLTVFQDYEHLVFGALMMLVMIFMPAGLLPSILRSIRGR